jgi:MFS transporter, DHA3 family, multidrug efflux protein
MNRFNRLVINNFFGLFSNSLIWFGIFFWVYIQTNSVIINSINAGAFALLTAISGPIFGKLLDKYNKKIVFIYSHLISIACYVLAFGIYTSIATNGVKENNPLLWAMILAVMIGVVLSNIRTIGLSSLVSTMVDSENIEKANGLVGATSGVSFVFTSSVSGLIMANLGINSLFGITIGMLTAVLIDLIFLNIPNNLEVSKDVDFSIRDSLKYLMAQKFLFRLVMFTTLNNFIGGTFQALADPYGLSLVNVQTWGFIWAFVGLFYIIGGILISKFGLGENPIKTLYKIYIIFWVATMFIAIQPSIWLMVIGFSIWMLFFPFIEACEQTIIQKRVPQEMQGRIFGVAHSIELFATPISAFLVGLITQLYVIPFMNDGLGARVIGSWFGTGQGRGIGLVFVITGVIGLVITLIIQSSNWLEE